MNKSMATIDELKKVRLDKLEALKKRGIDPYPATVKREQTIAEARSMDGKPVVVAGRIMGLRGHGKIMFADIRDESGNIQAVFKSDEIDAKTFELLALVDIGDFLAVQGSVGKTQAGEISVFVKDFQLITKSLRPLPDQWHGLKDVEERYRKRYLDTLLNPDVKKQLQMRSQIINTIRDFLTDRGFLEVETPTLQPIYGGGLAKPFVTHHNELNADLYLRISDEMYLKRLIVGGFEKVFEITKVFRNEGVDHDHNPEFTMFEAQIAYQDYLYGMDSIEEIIEYTALQVLGSTKFEYQGVLMDVKRPWPRFRMVEAISRYTGVDTLLWKTVDVAKEVIQKIETIPEVKFAELKKMHSIGECIAFVFEETVEAKLIQPTIVYDYPIENSPLAKKCDDPRFTQRFEMFAFGSELGNNYTELNDPVDLKKRFLEEKKREAAGIKEAHQTDSDYLEAIEQGFPPTCGISIGIDRLVMLLTGAKSIKDIIPFPTLRPELVSKQSRSKGSIRNSEYQIASDVTEKFPGISYAYTIIKDVTIHKSNSELEKLKGALVESKRNISIEEIQNIVPIKAYRQMFKDTGVDYHSRRPSPEALLRRISQGKSLYNINTAVDAYNLAVVETGIGLGGFDYDKISPPVTLRLSKRGEIMHLLGDDSPTQTEEGELVYSDAEKLLTLDLNYRDIEETKITDKTKNIILFADGGHGIDPEKIKAALELGVKYIQKYCGGAAQEVTLIQ